MMINFNNPITRNWYNIKEEFVEFLNRNNLTLDVDEDESRVVVYDKDGNDLEHMTLKQLPHRVKITL